jgi:S-adenosylmethionine:tRNA ribosyltransferase-isomerase
MSPATWPRAKPLDEQLLVIDPEAGKLRDARVGDLPSFLHAGDLVVVNDAATLPASLRGVTDRGAAIEARIFDGQGDGRFRALLFGPGDARQRTEDRPLPPALPERSVLSFGDDLSAVVEAVSSESPRLVVLAFRERGARLWSALYGRGRPVQYAYVAGPLELWHVQTRYAARPWAAEMPSAGRPLTWSLLLALLRRGVNLATLTHAAGLSSTGDAALDALLPMAERFDIPEITARAIGETRAAGGRIVAVGTTVARALEGCAAQNGGEVRAGEGMTDLVLTAWFQPRVVDGLVSGMHEPEASHFRLLEAFAPRALLARAHEHAEAHGYLGHEFGDSSLILRDAA